ncbi:YciI family protein [Nonomuraea sp. NPDC050536]|uniref:YciI family protein n=1 Tax=Nonomuraea sp. NPDC050536 TaxID=3364366 RepID=UPI0037C9968D
MKYLLVMNLNPKQFESLTEEQRDEIYRGHEELIETIIKSGEMVTTVALADPSQTVTVRVRDGRTVGTDGPAQASEEFFCGYYVVDCESKERAIELAALIPDARHSAVEVRPVMHEGGPEA